jgi:hypothetical protein
MTYDCDICCTEFEYEPVICEDCEATLCRKCVALRYNEMVGLCVNCHHDLVATSPADCHHFDLEAECPVDLCPRKAVCRRVRQEAGSNAVEPVESRADIEER